MIPVGVLSLVLTGTALGLAITPLILNARAWFTGQPPQLLLVWMVYRLAMPILIERMSA